MSETTLDQGVDAVDQFQGLFESGAFNADGQPDAQDAEIQGKQEVQEEQEEAPSWESFDDFLKAAKADPESVLNLPAKVKIDGQEKAVPLKDIIKSYQLEGHVNNKSIELSTAKAQFEAERVAARELARQQITQAQQLGQVAQQLINQDFQRINWDALRVQNPAEFAALQAEYQQRQMAVGQYMQNLQQQNAHLEHQKAQELQTQLLSEKEKLLNARPEWRDETKFAQERDSMVSYARKMGFSDAELGQLGDHRLMLLLHDAARFAALQAQAPTAVKQVREAPKMVKPGSRTTKAPGESQRAAVIERFNRNPRDLDAQAAVFEMFAG